MDLADRIELRRFVGRELLLWLWFESETHDATVETRTHGAVGLWVEGRLVLDEGRESTTIKGTNPGQHREAKEALLRGKTPERAGLHLALGDRECSLTLRGETLAFAGLSPPKAPAEDEAGESAPHDAFELRMDFVREVERLVEELYRDFLALRLSRDWEAVVAPALEAWVRGRAVDADAYEGLRKRTRRRLKSG